MMTLRAAEEAFFTAQEMERRAIRLYERAIMLFGQQEPMKGYLNAILKEEKEHLRRFEMLGGAYFPSLEEQTLLSSKAADALFTGGLVEAQRLGAFDSPRGLFSYAANEEKSSQAFYEDMARALMNAGENDAANALLSIAREESAHLCSLQKKLQELD